LKWTRLRLTELEPDKDPEGDIKVRSQGDMRARILDPAATQCLWPTSSQMGQISKLIPTLLHTVYLLQYNELRIHADTTGQSGPRLAASSRSVTYISVVSILEMPFHGFLTEC
jgi:hypothetical protein